MNSGFGGLIRRFLQRPAAPLLLLLASVILFLMAPAHFFGLTLDPLRQFYGLEHFSRKADDYPLSVHFLDVGQGDCIFIACEGRYAMIDTGDYSLHSKAVQYLERYGIDRLDLLIVTHTDSDHIGDFQSLSDHVRIDNVVLSPYDVVGEELSDTQKLFYDKLREEKLPVLDPTNREFPLGSATLRVLSPAKAYRTKNNNSLVIRLEYGQVSYLFTGDIGQQVEKELLDADIDLSADVLKIAHHGSRYATSQAFYDAVSPTYAVLSVSAENDYQLPHREVMDRIRASRTTLLRTDKNGDIIIATDGTRIQYYYANRYSTVAQKT